MGASSSIQNTLKGYDSAFFYSDYLVEIDTILDILKGWKITTKEPNYPLEEKVMGFMLGIMGSDNNLKANLVNRICGFGKKLPPINLNTFDLSQGLKVRMTKKIEKKKLKKGENPNPNRLICLFSGNLENPIPYTQNEMIMKFLNKKAELKDGSEVQKTDSLDIKQYEEIKSMIVHDKIITQRFVDDYILETSQALVILIKEMKFNDQKYVEDILRRYKEKKKIIIIHHLVNEDTILGVKHFIELRLKSLFLVRETYLDLTKWFTVKEIQENFLNKSIFVQQDVNEHLSLMNEEERIRVVHLVLAKEETNAGKCYNIPVYKYLEEFIKSNVQAGAIYNLQESFKKFLNEKHSNYFRILKKPSEKINEIQVKIVSKNNLKFLNPEISQKIKVNFLENLNFSILGEPFPLERKDYIPYQVLEKTNKVEIFLDIPFLQKESTLVLLNQEEPNFQYLIVSGIKKKANTTEIEGNNNISLENINEILGERGTAQYGPFELKIPLAQHSIRFKKNISSIYKNGILYVTFWKTTKNYKNIPINYIEKEVDKEIGSKDMLHLSTEIANGDKNSSFNKLMGRLDDDEKADKNRSLNEHFNDIILKSDFRSDMKSNGEQKSKENEFKDREADVNVTELLFLNLLTSIFFFYIYV